MWHWHFELTSACTLKCPRCSRTELPESLVIDHLTLDFFKDNFPPDVLKQAQRISLCGYDGDPIYNKQFLEIIKYFKTSNPTLELYIVTNGSYKKPDWWKQVGEILNEKDQIHFSLDGYDQSSNELYRVNSDWDSIIEGITALQGSEVRLVWDMIYFDFNYQYQSLMQQMAVDLGFDAMRITKSNKFNFYYNTYEKDLQPPLDYISSNGRFESETIQLSERHIYNTSFKSAIMRRHSQSPIGDIMPLCLIGTKGLYVDSQGYFYPCCWIVNKYNTPAYNQWLTAERNIKQSGLERVLNADCWKQFLADIPSNEICKLKCSTNEVTYETIVRW